MGFLRVVLGMQYFHTVLTVDLPVTVLVLRLKPFQRSSGFFGATACDNNT
jgi:hypothetical protein